MLQEYAKDEKYLSQGLQPPCLVSTPRTVRLLLEQKNMALGEREKFTPLHGSYRQDLGKGLILINTFFMSLCCSPLFELTADAKAWLHLPCIERSLDVRSKEMEQAWAARREQSETVRNDSLLQGVRCHCWSDLLNTKHLSEIQRKSSLTRQGGSAFLLKRSLCIQADTPSPQAWLRHCRQESLVKLGAACCLP